jgi:hypothetical protein
MVGVKPLCIDLFCGFGGWSEGFLAEGYECVGYDIEAHDYGTGGYPGTLILRDVRSIHGSEFKDATVIVASPPCQAYSYRAMPWSRAKALPPPDNTLFNECFRIQREACEAAGRYIPLIVENVRGAQKWVGRARWHYGSFYLWGDVPALMPMTLGAAKVSGFRFDGESHGSFQSAAVKVASAEGRRTDVGKGARFTIRDCGIEGRKHDGSGWTEKGSLRSHNRLVPNTGVKVSGDWFGSYADMKASGTISPGRLHGKHSQARKAASAMIAKIPYALSAHIARCFKPQETLDVD